MQKITDDEIEALKAKYAGVELNLMSDESLDMEIVARTPPQPEWDRFRTMQQDDAQAPFALRTLLLCCTIQPAPEELRKLIAGKPGIAETFGARLVKIAGVSSAATSRKL